MNALNLAPTLDNFSTDPLILTGTILMAFAIIIPCLIWFIRNIYRIVGKKDFWWMNRTLKYSWLVGIVVFIVGLILLIVKMTSGA